MIKIICENGTTAKELINMAILAVDARQALKYRSTMATFQWTMIVKRVLKTLFKSILANLIKR